jgi:hypothetical protein
VIGLIGKEASYTAISRGGRMEPGQGMSRTEVGNCIVKVLKGTGSGYWMVLPALLWRSWRWSPTRWPSPPTTVSGGSHQACPASSSGSKTTQGCYRIPTSPKP